MYSQIHCKKNSKKFYSQIHCKKNSKNFYSQIHCKKNSKNFYSQIHCKKNSKNFYSQIHCKKIRKHFEPKKMYPWDNVKHSAHKCARAHFFSARALQTHTFGFETFQKRFRSVSEAFQKRFRSVSEAFQKRFMVLKRFWSVSRRLKTLQICFWNASETLLKRLEAFHRTLYVVRTGTYRYVQTTTMHARYVLVRTGTYQYVHNVRIGTYRYVHVRKKRWRVMWRYVPMYVPVRTLQCCLMHA